MDNQRLLLEHLYRLLLEDTTPVHLRLLEQFNAGEETIVGKPIHLLPCLPKSALATHIAVVLIIQAPFNAGDLAGEEQAIFPKEHLHMSLLDPRQAAQSTHLVLYSAGEIMLGDRQIRQLAPFFKSVKDLEHISVESRHLALRNAGAPARLAD